MSESKTKKSVRNIFWGICYKSLTAFLPFVSRTIVIRILGIDYVGVGSLFTSILSVLSLAELGISESIIFSLYKPLAEERIDEVCALIKFYRNAYRIIGIVILLVGLVLNLRIDLFVSGDCPDDLNLQILFLIYLINTVSSYFLFSYYSVLLIASQRNDVEYKISSVITIVSNISQIVLLLLFENYYIYILVLPIMTVAQNILRAIWVKKNYPQIQCRGQVDNETKGVIKKQVKALVIGKLTVASRNSFDSIIISTLLGLTAVAVYNNYYYVMNMVYGFLVYFTAAIRGGIGNNIVTRSVKDNYADMLNLSTLFWFIYSISTVMLVCLYQPFMEWWVGEEYTYGLPFAILFCVYFYLLCNFLVFAQYMEAKGLYWENRIRYILEAVCNITLNIVLGYFFGVYGIVMATIVSVLILTNIYGTRIGFKYYFTGCNMRNYFISHTINLLITVGACVVAYRVCFIINVRGLLGLLIKAFVAACVSIILMLLAKFKTTEFNSAKTYILSRLKTIK